MNIAVIAYGIVQYDLNHLIAAYHNIVTRDGLYALGAMSLLQVFLILSQILRLKKISGDSFQKSFRIYIAGAAANSIIPMRIGEGHRLVSAAVNSPDNLKKHISAVVYERGADLYYTAALIVLSIYITYATPTPPQTIGILLILCLLFAIAFNPIGLTAEKLLKTFIKNAKYKKTLLDLLTPIINGTKGNAQIFNALTLIINICIPTIGISIYFSTYNNALNAGVEVIIATLVLMAVPITPGAVGVFEVTISSLLNKTFDTNIETTLAFAISYHFAIMMPQIIMFIGEFFATACNNAIKKGRQHQ